MNHKAGDEVEFELHGAKHRHRIEKIEAWKAETPAPDAAPASEPAPVPNLPSEGSAPNVPA